jgi:hypothetical protein
VVFELRGAGLPGGGDENAFFHEFFGGGISVQGGLATLRRLLSSDASPPHVLVLAQQADQEESSVAQPQAQSSRHKARPPLSNPLVPATGPDEETLVEVWQDILGVAPIGVEDDFLHLGGNSMTALQLAYTSGHKLGVALPDTVVFQHPTISKLAKAIQELRGDVVPPEVEELRKEVDALSDDQVSQLLEEVEGGEPDGESED